MSNIQWLCKQIAVLLQAEKSIPIPLRELASAIYFDKKCVYNNRDTPKYILCLPNKSTTSRVFT